MLQIYNSLTRKKEPLDPIVPGKVRMYVCGMTVYDYCHLGHAMSMVAFDVIARYIRSLGLELTYVRNITDIEDKIIKRANENGEEFRVLTRRFIDAMHEDERALGIEAPDQEPCATDYIEQMLQIIGTLVEKGFAYVGGNGDVYYDVSRFEGYGKLSGRRPDDLRAGARVEVDEAKNDPLDFVLWKSEKPGEPSWDSPWGRGRPGWHIECSAMAMESLGTQFDIHGGGTDLTFPHHENEIAQSEAATGEPFARIWIHNGHVRIDDEKMSKSLGNFFTVREMLAQYPAEVIRYFLVSGHYRSPLNYSPTQMDNARSALARLYTALRGIPIERAELNSDYLQRFQRAMNDDFNTPEALAVMFDLARDINRAREASSLPEAGGLAATLKSLGGVLGLLHDDPEHHLQGDGEDLDRDAVEALIEQRNAARAAKDYAEADRIRVQLDAAGVVLEDSGGGTSWRRKR